MSSSNKLVLIDYTKFYMLQNIRHFPAIRFGNTIESAINFFASLLWGSLDLVRMQDHAEITLLS